MKQTALTLKSSPLLIVRYKITSLFSFSDYEGTLLEQARCFFHISHVYHAEGRHKESFMAALQQLNTAEKIGTNFHEVRVK